MQVIFWTKWLDLTRNTDRIDGVILTEYGVQCTPTLIPAFADPEGCRFASGSWAGPCCTGAQGAL
jgi:hypothetical protein